MHGACYWQCPTTGKNSVKKFLEPEHHQSLITRCQSHIPRLKIFIKIRRQLFEMSCWRTHGQRYTDTQTYEVKTQPPPTWRSFQSMWAERERPIFRSALKPIFMTPALRSPCFLPAPLHFRFAQRSHALLRLLSANDFGGNRMQNADTLN